MPMARMRVHWMENRRMNLVSISPSVSGERSMTIWCIFCIVLDRMRAKPTWITSVVRTMIFWAMLIGVCARKLRVALSLSAFWCAQILDKCVENATANVWQLAIIESIYRLKLRCSAGNGLVFCDEDYYGNFECVIQYIRVYHDCERSTEIRQQSQRIVRRGLGRDWTH